MALNGTMVKIETVTVGSGGAANIEFTNIPQTYTDLYIVTSARSTRAFTVDDLAIQFNGSTSNLSNRRLLGDGGSVYSDSATDIRGVADGDSATASTFGNTSFYIPNYTSSNNKSVSVDGVAENNATGSYMWFVAGLWSNTAAITSIKLVPNNGTLKQYSTATLYGISRTTSQIKATGGIVYDTDTHVYHLFNASGTFTPTQNLTVDYLVVAGGGGGASFYSGGGGAGGLRSTVTATGGGGSLESALSLTANTGYTVTVGAGGAAGTDTVNPSAGSDGGNSVFSTITSTGGGGGGTTNGRTGGSGGGASGFSAGSTGGSGTTNQGFKGGNSLNGASGGGGGAGAAAANATSASPAAVATAGGNGVAVSITGTSVTYAGGGGGGAVNGGPANATGGAGGSGGGGAGNGTVGGSGTAGTANTGGGGGGGAYNGSGAAGGSGVVIVRYAK